MFGAFLDFFGAEARRGQVILIAATNFPMGLARQRGLRFAYDVGVAWVASLPGLQLPTVRMLLDILAQASRWADDETDQAGASIT